MSQKRELQQELDAKVAVASGCSTDVRRWSQSLRRAAIHFEVASCYTEDPSCPADYAEIWVLRRDVDQARSTLREASRRDRSRMW